jgi:putative transposase
LKEELQMTTLIAHRIELATTPVQADYFRRTCATARFVWNWALAQWIGM